MISRRAGPPVLKESRATAREPACDSLLPRGSRRIGENVRRRRSEFLIVLLLAAVFIAQAALFLRRLSLWTDEATQMQGILLGPISATSWLAGDGLRLGVPPDRMPPLSYWVGWAWSQLFGLSEISLRWLGVSCAALALVVIYDALRQTSGTSAAAGVTLYLALSPNIVVFSAEIRPYALFLLLCAAGAWFAVRIALDPQHYSVRSAVGLGCAIVAAAYTHFYGMLFGAAVAAALVGILLGARGRLRPIMLAFMGAGAAVLPALVFVRAALAMGGGDRSAEALRGLVRLAYRLVAHPVSAINPYVELATIGSAAILVLLAAFVAFRGHRPARFALIALVAGFLAIAVVSAVRMGFDPAAPHYNLWMAPLVALTFGGALAARTKAVRMTAIAACALLIGCTAYLAVQLVRYGALYAHGASNQLAALVPSDALERTLVVYEAQGTANGHVYFPLYYNLRDRIRQMEAFDSSDPLLVRPTHRSGETAPMSLLEVTAHCDRIIAITAHRTSSAQIAEIIHQRRYRQSPPIGRTAAALERTGAWRVAASRYYPSLISTEAIVLERVE